MHKFVTSQLAFRTPYEKNDHMYILTAWNSYDLWRMNLNFLTVPCALEIKLTIIKHITGNWKFDLGVILRPDKLSTKSFTKLWDTCTFKKHCPAKFIHTLQLIMSDLNYINFLYELFCTIHNIIPVALDSYKIYFFLFNLQSLYQENKRSCLPLWFLKCKPSTRNAVSTKNVESLFKQYTCSVHALS